MPKSRSEAYQYNRQASEDDQDHHTSEGKTRASKGDGRGTYRPTALTWPFILLVTLLFAAALGLVVYTYRARNDDHEAAQIIDRRRSLQVDSIFGQGQQHLTLTQGIDQIDMENSQTAAEVAVLPTVTIQEITSSKTCPIDIGSPIPTLGPVLTSNLGGETDSLGPRELTTFVVSTKASKECGPVWCTFIETIETYVTTSTTSYSTVFETITVPIVPKPVPKTTTITSVNTKTYDFTKTITTTKILNPGKVTTVTVTTPIATSIFMPFLSCGPVGTSSPLTSSCASEGMVTKTYYTTDILETTSPVKGPGKTTVFQTEFLIPTVTKMTTLLTSEDLDIPEMERTSTIPVATSILTYIQTGPTTLYNTVTYRNADGAPETGFLDTVGTVVTSGDRTTTEVVKGGPTTIITNVPEVVTSWVTPDPITAVSTVPVRDVVQENAFVETVRFAGEEYTTVVTTTVGGGWTTFVSQPPPETLVRTVDGTATTEVITPAARTFTVMDGGGTPTVMTVVATATEDVISSWVAAASPSGGYLTTIVTTPPPTLVVMTISDRLTTMMTTVPPTTRVSVVPGTTYTTDVTLTATGNDEQDDDDTRVIVQEQVIAGFTAAEYFAGKFLPGVAAVVLAMLLRTVDQNVKLYQPFAALSREGGASGAHSLALHYDGVAAVVAAVTTLAQGHPLPFLSTLAVALAALIVPLSSEAIGIKLTGTCERIAVHNCAGYFGVAPTPAVFLIALLALILALLLVLLLLLLLPAVYNTGVRANPWSVAGIGPLAGDANVRTICVDVVDGPVKRSAARLAKKHFALRPYKTAAGCREDRIVLVHDESANLMDESSSRTGSSRGGWENDGGFASDGSTYKTDPTAAASKRRRSVDFMALTWAWRLAFVSLTLGMFGLTLYYHLTHSKRNALKDWIQRQSFGVKFLFSGVGVVVALSFHTFFRCEFFSLITLPRVHPFLPPS